MREKAPEKAVRLLRDGKVRIVEVRPEHVKAVVIGDHGIYEVDRFEGRWYCDCPALGPCSHAIAASRVVG